MTQANRLAIEGALDRGHLWAKMGIGRYLVLRRNGKTKLWKTQPDRFEIPVKAGFRATGHVSNISITRCMTDLDWQSADFIVSEGNPAKQ